ncbi:MAG: TspO protein [Leptolyngbyaceae cyanobacterium SL_7_1]|nr:TspO protein [Leptolyngbyaceae cyanobacterium SL_7_1]
MPNHWTVIASVTLLIELGSFFIRLRDLSWAKRLDRPDWLFFEPAIPVIWMVVFASGAVSAGLVWQHDPGSLKIWMLMGVYLVLELITVAYIPAILRSRSLVVGTILGGTGVGLGLILFLLVGQISPNASLFLLPYLIWSPIGTYATRQMIDLNPKAV